MFGLRKFHFTRQKVNFFKVKFKLSVLSASGHKTSWSLMSSVVNFLVFSVDSRIKSWKSCGVYILYHSQKLATQDFDIDLGEDLFRDIVEAMIAECDEFDEIWEDEG